jgi:hypothetical protein
MGLGEIERDQPAHGMAEGDDRQARMTLADQRVDGGDIGDHLRCAVPMEAKAPGIESGARVAPWPRWSWT